MKNSKASAKKLNRFGCVCTSTNPIASYAGSTRLVVVTAYFTDGSSVSSSIEVILGSMFPVPETPFGALAALGVGLAIFGMIKLKHKKPSSPLIFFIKS
jgi:hypothetical protein